VLGVVAAASLMSAAVLVTGDSTATAADRHAERVHLRAAAWSGLQSLMADLAAQREDLLVGADPRLELDLTLSDDSSPDRILVRLVPWTKSDADPRDAAPAALPEPARLNLNLATPEMLAALGVPEPAVSEITARRAARAFASVEELATLATPIPPEITDLLTTLAYDPNIQTGLATPDAALSPRFNLAEGWSEELSTRLSKQLGPDATAALKRLVDQTPSLKSDSDLFAALLQQGVPRDLYPAAFDILTVSDDLYVPGRIDLLRASERVLAAIPGLNKETAAALAAARAQLSEDERRSRVWPLTRDLIPPEDFTKAIPWLASRSTQWRVRVLASIESPSADAPRVIRSAVYEAVIDAAGETPRLAYFREVTLLPLAQVMRDRVGTLARAIAERTPPAPPSASLDDPPPPPPEPDSNGSENSAATPPNVDNPANGDAPASGTGGILIDRRRGRWNAGRTP
jgi:DNA uptake protein ComE-like DNA-binding protein